MKKYFTVIMCLMIAGMASAYNGPSRILEARDPKERNMNPTTEQEQCEAKRAKALRLGCISQEEYNALRNFGSYPTCDYDDDPQVMLKGWGPCGCFHPDTQISSFSSELGGDVDVKAGFITENHKSFEVYHLDQKSNLGKFNFEKTGLRIPTSGPEAHPLVVVHTVDGKVLKLTTKHPVLTSEGKMIQVKDLKESDQLMNMDGTAVRIAKIESEQFMGNVVNFMIDTDISKKNEHIIFAEGLAVGDLAWQSSLEDELNKITLRQ